MNEKTTIAFEYWNGSAWVNLAGGEEVQRQTSPSRRSSFLSVRLSAREIEALHRAAAGQGVPPSTLARHLIIQGLRALKEAVAQDKEARALERRVQAVEARIRKREER